MTFNSSMDGYFDITGDKAKYTNAAMKIDMSLGSCTCHLQMASIFFIDVRLEVN